MNVHTLFAVLVIATALSSLALPAQAEQPRAVTRMLYRAAESSIPQVFSVDKFSVDGKDGQQHYDGATSEVIWTLAASPKGVEHYRYRVVARSRPTFALFEIYYCFNGQRLNQCSKPRTLLKDDLVTELTRAKRADLITKFGLVDKTT